MSNIFVTSDQHWGHANILKFQNAAGQFLRPGFEDVKTMNEFMVDQWNKVVKPSDKVYHLGDVALRKPDIAWVGACYGHKRLVRGNHDTFPTKAYLKFFEEIYATRLLDNMLLSHIPIHVESIKSEWTNVHGHTHNNVSPLHFGPKYFNVCVEYTEYRPLALEEIKQRIQAQQAEWEKTHVTMHSPFTTAMAGLKL